MEEYLEAGRILTNVLKKWGRRIRGGMDDLEIAEEIEKELKTPAFPCNLSLDSEAAHYTPFKGRKIPEKGLLKLDCGVHIDGYIVDAAITIDLGGEMGNMVECAERALEEAISVIKPGIELREVGRVVEEVAKSYGFRSVSNLGGHSIGRYNLHSGKFVPNVGRGGGVVEEGDVLAVEPFISEGSGYVRSTSMVEIFSLTPKKPPSFLIKVWEDLWRRYRGLPFARRWLDERERRYIPLLLGRGSLSSHPVLKDDGLVAQAETTVYVDRDGAIPLVKHLSFL